MATWRRGNVETWDETRCLRVTLACEAYQTVSQRAIASVWRHGRTASVAATVDELAGPVRVDKQLAQQQAAHLGERRSHFLSRFRADVLPTVIQMHRLLPAGRELRREESEPAAKESRRPSQICLRPKLVVRDVHGDMRCRVGHLRRHESPVQCSATITSRRDDNYTSASTSSRRLPSPMTGGAHVHGNCGIRSSSAAASTQTSERPLVVSEVGETDAIRQAPACRRTGPTLRGSAVARGGLDGD